MRKAAIPTLLGLSAALLPIPTLADPPVMETKFVIDDNESADDIALEGDTVVIGRRSDDTIVGEVSWTGSGVVYVYTRVEGEWAQQAELRADDEPDLDDGGPDDPDLTDSPPHLGQSVALSGETLVAGAPHKNEAGNDSGAAYVFVRDAGVWTQQAKLVPDDGEPDENFGHDVAIVGDTILVGARFDDDLHNTGFLCGRGSVYVFERAGSNWFQVDQLYSGNDTCDAFGWSVSMEGNTAVIGARDEGTDLADPFEFVKGAAFVYRKTGGSWKQVARLVPDERKDYEEFGHDVDISGNRIIIGAPGFCGTLDCPGAAYIFGAAQTVESTADVSGDGIPDLAVSGHTGVWAQQAQLLAGDGESQDGFGGKVAIDGDRVMVGSEFHDHPLPPSITDWQTVYSFHHQDGSWTEDVELPRLSELSMFNGNVLEAGLLSFGDAFDIDGDTAVVGTSAGTLLEPTPQQGEIYTVYAMDNAANGSPGGVHFISGADGSPIETIGYMNSNWLTVAHATIADGDGDGTADDPAVAVLGDHASNGQHKVQMRDVATGALVGAGNIVFFNADFETIDLAVLNDTNGDGDPSDPSIAVLARDRNSGHNVIQLRRVADGGRIGRWAQRFFWKSWDAKAVAASAPVGGVPKIVVLATKKATGHSWVEARGASDGVWSPRIFFYGASVNAIDLAVLTDRNGNGTANDPAYAVLGIDSAAADVARVRRATDGVKLKDIQLFGTAWVAQGLSVVPDMNDNMFEEIAGIATEINDGRTKIKISDFGTKGTLEEFILD